MPVFGEKDFRPWRALLCALIALSSVKAPATSVIAPSLETLVDRAELIFTGQVVSQHSEWRASNGQKSIITLVTFGVEQLHKGQAASVVTLQFLGGKMGDVSLEVAESPKFRTGERVVLFVEGNGVNASPVVGFFHGRFSLQRDKAGHETVFKYNGEPLIALPGIGPAKQALAIPPRGEAMTHDAFASQIRRRVASTAK
jgi:hypothetical protein